MAMNSFEEFRKFHENIKVEI